MKIDSIRISNILSFEYKDNIDQCDEIVFDKKLNILIGPNGAGKSNFLEIITKLFQDGLFYRCTFAENQIKSHQTNPLVDLRDTIAGQNRQLVLPINNKSNNDKQQIKLKISLSDNDKKNLLLILNNTIKINQLFSKYTRQQIVFPTIAQTEITNYNSITLFFESSSGQILRQSILQNGVETFVALYLQYFNYLQHIFYIAKKDGENWEPLKNTFALISGYRNYNQFESTMTVQPNRGTALQQIKSNMANETTKTSTNAEPLVFPFVRHIIGYAYHDMRNEIGTPKDQDPINLFKNETFVRINKILHETLDLRLYIHRPDDDALNYTIRFIDEKTGKYVNVVELSAGEKGIIHFIFSIHGYDLENGVMIIDEPEIHLHPQIQQKYVDIIFDAIKDFDMQFIIATHSPIFINQKTIEFVYRFHKENGYTRITKPRTLSPTERELFEIINYTNSAKVFFAEKVILVEGKSDEYFYRYYLDYYKNKKKLSGSEINVGNLEFLDIDGKPHFEQWKSFLSDYKISWFYIGDCDNLLKSIFSAKHSYFKNTYNTLKKPQLTSMRTSNRNDWNDILRDVVRNYKDGVFFLHDGELEDYINQIGSKLENVIDFCRNRFTNWINNAANKGMINELDFICYSITK